MVSFINLIYRPNIYKRLLRNNSLFNVCNKSVLKYRGLAVSHITSISYFAKDNLKKKYATASLLTLHRKWCSKGLIDKAFHNINNEENKVPKYITEIFPLPRVTLNELNAKTPSQIFDIHYKQNSVAPKSKKKKNVQNDWTCTYSFVWPEKIKFESTSVSKRLAAEKAATQAIHWLYLNKRIDGRGLPIYDRNVLEDIKSSLNEPITAFISDKSVKLVENIWNEYENGIKDIYEKTFEESKNKIIQSTAVITKDSTLDEDGSPEIEEELDPIDDVSELKQQVHPVYGRRVKTPTQATLDRRNKVLKSKFQEYAQNIPALPIDEYGDVITSTLEKSRVAVIIGEAGCGKSTRAPPAILRHCGADAAIIVSEPRRVAALGLAESVANELGEQVGESVGFQVRLQTKLPRVPGGAILYCTSGVLLRRLQTNPGLEGCTHVFIDEAHERDVNTDVTLLLLRRALELNPQLKIIIMSATLDTDIFIKYFDPCPVIKVPGRAFPVEVYYLEDIQQKFNLSLSNTVDHCEKEDGKPMINCQEVVSVIKAVDAKEKEGAILVFLPGWAEIKLTKQLLDDCYGQSGLHMILPVHSRLSTSDQTKMFAAPPPGVRKIVLATNIAETSITIRDVVHVIDTGANKENRIKEDTGTASLETVWVSLAGAKQRAGRAGRVQPGNCYRMYTKKKESDFVVHTTPEILRIPLEQTVLDCKSYAPNESTATFLSQLPEPPSDKAIRYAVNDLIEMGALTPQEHLTRLGDLLTKLTLHPRIGRTLIHSGIVGNVLATCNMVAHCSSNTEIFVNAVERREEIRDIKQKYNSTSDHAALFWIQDEFETELQTSGRSASDTFCQKYGLRGERLAFIRSLTTLHLEQLLKSGLLPSTVEAEELNQFSGVDELLSAVLLSGADTLLITNRRVKTKGKMNVAVDINTSTGDKAHIASESVNRNITKRAHKTQLLSYFGGHHSSERRALVVYKTSSVPPHTAVLFCTGDIVATQNNEDTTVLSISKHRLKIHMPSSQAEHLLKLRQMLWNTFQYYIERDLKSLEYDDYSKVAKFKVGLMKVVGRILVEAQSEVEGKRINDVTEIR